MSIRTPRRARSHMVVIATMQKTNAVAMPEIAATVTVPAAGVA